MILKPKVKKPKLKAIEPNNSKPKVKLKAKKKLSTKLPTLSTTDFPSWSEEELEEFISNSYSGKFHNINDRWKNFPLKPQMQEREVIDSIDRLREVAEEWRNVPAFAFDTETNTLEVLGDNKKFRLVCITVSWGDYNNYEIPLGYLRDEDIERNLFLDEVVEIIRPIFENPNVLIVGHNLKYDFHVLRRVGITVVTDNLFDTMLASWICDENTPNGLKENSAEKMSVPQTHFNEVTNSIPNDVKKAFGYKANAKVHDFGLVLIDDGEEYCIGDAFYTWCNFLGFRQEIIDESMDKIFYIKMIPFLKVLLEMEERGTTVDVDRLKEMGEEMKEDLEALQYKIYELAGCVFNVGSSAQKSLILFGIDDYTMPFDEYLEKYKKKNAKRLANSKNGLDVKKVKKTYDDKQRDPQRCEVLENCFDFKVQGYTASGAPSTDADTIWKLSQMQYKNKRKQEGVEMCKAIAEYSKLEKLKTAFVDGILEQLYEDGKAHPSFNQIGTDSGRLSCSKPNLQQLPKADEDAKYQIRSVFVGSLYAVNKFSGAIFDVTPEEAKKLNKKDFEVKRKKIIAIDYHNLEMVCLTHFSHDKNLTEMFANDDDAHGSTAVNMFELDCTPTECKKKYPHLRQAAKTLNFLLMYGGGAQLLYENLKGDHFSPVDLGSKEYLEQYNCRSGKEVAQKYIDKYFDSYSGVAKFISSQKKFAHKHGYVNTVLGRKRRLPDINSRDMGKSSYCERLAVNSAIQGTAGDITISAQLRVESEKALKEMLCYMLIQIHDEVVLECPEEYLEEAIKIIKHDMEFPFGDNSRNIEFLRADYDTGNSYQEAK